MEGSHPEGIFHVLLFMKRIYALETLRQDEVLMLSFKMLPVHVRLNLRQRLNQAPKRPRWQLAS